MLGAALVASADTAASTDVVARSYQDYDPRCPPEAAPSDDSDPTRVMIVGDSMSNGFSGDWTWRYMFDKYLESEGVDVDLVGSLNDVVDPVSGAWWQHDYVRCDFDQDHDARVLAQLASWLRAPAAGTVPSARTLIGQEVLRRSPDVVIEFMGFNDLTRPRYPATTGRPFTVDQLLANVVRFVAEVRAANPNATVVLTTLASTETDPRATYRSRLKTLAASLDRPRATEDFPVSRIVVADALQYWAGASDTWDGFHPNSRGETHLTRAMADAFARLGMGRGASFVPAAPPVGPRTAPRLKASAAVGRLTLAWGPPPRGATRMLVYCREPSVSAQWTRHRDATISTVPSSNRAVLSTCRKGRATAVGHTYQVRVRAAKGTSVAADIASQTLTRTVPRR
ncbi:MAG: fibronectin, type [Marmoricola sp.]|nr:fibronectin, type [Marmoricola sp.]